MSDRPTDVYKRYGLRPHSQPLVAYVPLKVHVSYLPASSLNTDFRDGTQSDGVFDVAQSVVGALLTSL